MQNNRKYILDKFQDYALVRYKDYCDIHGLVQSFEGFLTFLIDQELIPFKVIKQFTIKIEFSELYPKREHKKTKTVIEIADRFNISERSVWSIIKQYSKSEVL